MDLREMRLALDKKEIGAEELAKSYIDKIEKTDKKLNSYITVCADMALNEAKAAQKLIDSCADDWFSKFSFKNQKNCDRSVFVK